MLGFAQHHGQQAVLQGVAAEDIGDLGAQHRTESVVQQRPRRMFARGTAAEIAAGDQYFAALRLRLCSRRIRRSGCHRPIKRQSLKAKRPRPLRSVVVRKRAGMMRSVSMFSNASTMVRERIRLERLHAACSLRLQVIGGIGDAAGEAQAAATAGLASTVRAPGPWRPSKLRLLVLTTSWPGSAISPFMAMHIEQPGSRHSAPAARNTWSQAFGFGLRAGPAPNPEPPACAHAPATFRPCSTCGGGAQVADTRELVQLPTNTTSTLRAQQRLARHRPACTPGLSVPGNPSAAGIGACNADRPCRDGCRS